MYVGESQFSEEDLAWLEPAKYWIEANLGARISITQIAEQLGFCDVFHLSKRVKQSTGFSPQQYRKRF